MYVCTVLQYVCLIMYVQCLGFIVDFCIHDQVRHVCMYVCTYVCMYACILVVSWVASGCKFVYTMYACLIKKSRKIPKRWLTNMLCGGSSIVDIFIIVARSDEAFVTRDFPILVELGLQNHLRITWLCIMRFQPSDTNVCTYVQYVCMHCLHVSCVCMCRYKRFHSMIIDGGMCVQVCMYEYLWICIH